MKRFFTAIALAAGVAGLANARAQQGPDQPRKAVTDADFVKEAASDGSAEVALGKLAQERATDAAVKKFGRQMVEDHTKANKQLLQIAGEKKMAVPETILPKHQMVADRLKKLDGAEFDREYMKAQAKSHKEAVALFEAEANGGQDDALKTFAANTLPIIREHYNMAREMAGETKGARNATTGTDAGSSAERPGAAAAPR